MPTPQSQSRTLYMPIAGPPTPAPSPGPSVVATPTTPFPAIPSISNPTLRREFLSAILGSCTPTELLFISTTIAPLLKRDFLSSLPVELAFQVLGFIDDHLTLTRAVQVSKCWRRLVLDEYVWKRMCFVYDFDEWDGGVAGSQEYFINVDSEGEDGPDDPILSHVRAHFKSTKEDRRPEQSNRSRRTGTSSDSISGSLPVSPHSSQNRFHHRRHLVHHHPQPQHPPHDPHCSNTLADFISARGDADNHSNADHSNTIYNYNHIVTHAKNNDDDTHEHTDKNRGEQTIQDQVHLNLPEHGPLEEMEKFAHYPMDPALEWLITSRKQSSDLPLDNRMDSSQPTVLILDDSESAMNVAGLKKGKEVHHAEGFAQTAPPHGRCDREKKTAKRKIFSYRKYFKDSYVTMKNWRSGGHLLRSHRIPIISPADSGVITSLAIDSDWVVVGLANSKIHVFSAKTGVLARTLVGHESGVWAVCLVSKGGSWGGDPDRVGEVNKGIDHDRTKRQGVGGGTSAGNDSLWSTGEPVASPSRSTANNITTGNTLSPGAKASRSAYRRGHAHAYAYGQPSNGSDDDPYAAFPSSGLPTAGSAEYNSMQPLDHLLPPSLRVALGLDVPSPLPHASSSSVAHSHGADEAEGENGEGESCRERKLYHLIEEDFCGPRSHSHHRKGSPPPFLPASRRGAVSLAGIGPGTTSQGALTQKGLEHVSTSRSSSDGSFNNTMRSNNENGEHPYHGQREEDNDEDFEKYMNQSLPSTSSSSQQSSPRSTIQYSKSTSHLRSSPPCSPASSSSSSNPFGGSYPFDPFAPSHTTVAPHFTTSPTSSPWSPLSHNPTTLLSTPPNTNTFSSYGFGQPSSLVISGGCDKVLRVWDISTGFCIYALPGHTSTIRCIRMLDYRPVAITGSRDSTLRVWDVQKGKLLRVLSGHSGSVRCLDVWGTRVVSGSYDTTCRLWDVDSGECIYVLRGHHHQIYSVAYDGVHIASGGLDTTVRVWSANTGECVALLTGHTALVCQLQLSPTLLVTGGSDGRVITFSLSTYTALHRIAAHDSSVTSLQFDKNFLVTGGNDGRVRLFRMNDGGYVRDLSEEGECVWKVAFVKETVAVMCKRRGKTVMEIWSMSSKGRDAEGEISGKNGNIEAMGHQRVMTDGHRNDEVVVKGNNGSRGR